MNSLDKMEDYDSLKQERNELAAQVEVMRDAGNYVVSAIRERTFSGEQTLEVLENALSTTPSAALREIQARTIEAAQLQWEEKGAHHIYKTDRCAFAPVAVLEHSVGRAGFEVFYDNEGWRCMFWHGNRGHEIACRLLSRESAQSVAQEHADRLVAALTGSEMAAAKRKGITNETDRT